MNGHAEEVEEKELEKGEQVKSKEESDTNASAGTEVTEVELCILLYLQQSSWPVCKLFLLEW